MPSPRVTTYLLLLVVVIVWGSYPTLIKVALPEDGPVRKVFALCHLDRVFDTFRDVAAAVASYLK